jgi:hypothetical protein
MPGQQKKPLFYDFLANDKTFYLNASHSMSMKYSMSKLKIVCNITPWAQFLVGTGSNTLKSAHPYTRLVHLYFHLVARNTVSHCEAPHHS